mmetsp:Transcript_8732/g.26272  ORF Transcript_8732/g.26272 Transcript_8732/m.26272 type:complete len:444 (+) Transcript_8732:205-1536(+)
MLLRLAATRTSAAARAPVALHARNGSWVSTANTEMADKQMEGAKMMYIVRHAERHDRSTPDGWSELALRPQDTPLSQRGLRQSRRLGKWFYGRLPVQRPLAIFASPFIRCIQTADAIASELEGLQRAGLHGASATRICVEPGLVEDMRYMQGLKHREPWFLRAADLLCISSRVDLEYKPLRDVKFVRGPDYPGPCVEVGDPNHRLNTIAHEIAEHPLVAAGGTAIVVTHGKPSADLIRSLAPAPGGIALPSYEDIKAGRYDGPPLHYTAVTALSRDTDLSPWDLAPHYELFSNEHDPRLSSLRKNDQDRATRYVVGDETLSAASVGPTVPAHRRGPAELEIAAADLAHFAPGQHVHVDADPPLRVQLPFEFRPGDVVRVRLIGERLRRESAETNEALAKRFGGGMMFGSSCTPPKLAVDDELEAAKEDEQVKQAIQAGVASSV